MNIALLSDIHANEVALRAVLEDARAAHVEHLLCCGDFVGYYYAPQAVVELLNAWPWNGIRGNHEAMLEAWIAGQGRDSIQRKYGSGISVAAQMSGEAISGLLNLPVRRELAIEGRSVLLCHGSSWDPDHYIYPDASSDEKLKLAEEGHDLVVFGHSHHQVVWQINHTTVVNPGSVGQPRDRKAGAAWGLWDTREMTVTLRRTEYDPSSLVQLAQSIDPELPYLANILTRH